MNKKNKSLPKGYKFWNIGEQIQYGDLYWFSVDNVWIEVTRPKQNSAFKSDHLIRVIQEKARQR